ncbi:hypothetical protein SFR_3302 [Streptomyces sp. FR-008]|nr:hypothetical protein SFR_3302 [Streptomyces sp. FR-008]
MRRVVGVDGGGGGGHGPSFHAHFLRWCRPRRGFRAEVRGGVGARRWGGGRRGGGRRARGAGPCRPGWGTPPGCGIGSRCVLVAHRSLVPPVSMSSVPVGCWRVGSRGCGAGRLTGPGPPRSRAWRLGLGCRLRPDLGVPGAECGVPGPRVPVRGTFGRARPSLSCGGGAGCGLPAPVVRLRPPGWRNRGRLGPLGCRPATRPGGTCA